MSRQGSHASSDVKELLYHLVMDRELDPECHIDDGTFEFDNYRVTSTGVDMGRPGTKGLLTLLSLAAEHEASERCERVVDALDFVEETNTTFEFAFDRPEGGGFSFREILFGEAKETVPEYYFNTEKVTVPSLFSSAGDDQIQVSTIERLFETDKCHDANSMVRKPEQDLLSEVGGIYCERMILRTGEANFRNPVTGPYENSSMVDSLKVRLFSPCTKAQESSNEPNPAIGKAKLLFQLASFLDVGWDEVQRELVPFRFQTRMYKHLPKLENGVVDPIVHLPWRLGGLGIPPPDGDYETALSSLSEGHLYLINAALQGCADWRLFRTLGSLMRDRYGRGVLLERNPVDEMVEEMSDSLRPRPYGLHATIEQMGLEVHEIGYRAKRNRLSRHGMITDGDLKRLLGRSFLQKELLLGENPTRGWVQADWQARRRAFESSVSRLVELHSAEGRVEAYGFHDVETVNLELQSFEPKELSDLGFQEEVFLHKEMWVGDPLDPDDRIYPVKDIYDGLVKFEIPSVSQKRWFPVHGVL